MTAPATPTTPGRTAYAGADWIRKDLGCAMSPFGELVADILGAVYGGIYHMDVRALRRADWSCTYYIRVAIRPGNFATFDGSSLTQLVILAHDAAVRVNVGPAGPGRLALEFWPRRREGRMSERHPTIEDAVEQARAIAHVEPLS